jgi:hypothetical protein
MSIATWELQKIIKNQTVITTNLGHYKCMSGEGVPQGTDLACLD